MIPKIIHYCWFGGKPKPDDFYKWLETWKMHCPDYEIMEWNEDNFDVDMFHYTHEAYRTRDYAFVSDVCRIYALNKYGGVYLDTDVELRASFDDYLRLRAFASIERPLVGTSTIGASKEMPWLKEFLNYYQKTHFINIWGHTVRTPNTKILTRRVLPKVSLADWPTIFPRDFFCGVITPDGTPAATSNTVSIHHFAGSWLRKKTFRQRVTAIIDGLAIRYFGK